MIAVPFVFRNGDMLSLKEEINNLLQATKMQRMDLVLLARFKMKCVTKESMMDFYKGGNPEFKKSLGDIVENFLAKGMF